MNGYDGNFLGLPADVDPVRAVFATLAMLIPVGIAFYLADPEVRARRRARRLEGRSLHSFERNVPQRQEKR